MEYSIEQIGFSGVRLIRLMCVCIAAAFLSAAGSGGDTVTLQDMNIAGRVLTFQDDQPSGALTMAVVYAPANSASQAEAQDITLLLGSGLRVGRLILSAVAIAQDRVASAGRFDAVFATVGLDDNLLRAVLMERHVPCLTLHPSQVVNGPCVVAIRSAPTVSIMLSSANAASSGVRFATAFRMMVNEK